MKHGSSQTAETSGSQDCRDPKKSEITDIQYSFQTFAAMAITCVREN
jgi:hypothetical protein